MGIQRILLVDDDAAVRTVLSRILGRLGATIVEAASAPEAISRLAERFDLVITDVRLGEGGSGIDVARAAAALHPAPPVIAMRPRGSRGW